MSAPNPAEWDPEAWIAGIPTERTVTLTRPNPELDAEVARLEAAAAALPEGADDDAERGLNDPSPAQIRVRLEHAVARRAADVITFRIRELDPEEIKEARAVGVQAGVDPGDAETLGLYVIAAAVIEPALSPEHVIAMSKRGRAGMAMVAELASATVVQWRVDPPSSRASSTSPGTPGSSGR